MVGVTRGGPLMTEGTSGGGQNSDSEASGDASPEPVVSAAAQVIIQAGGTMRVGGELNVGNTVR